MCNPTVPKAHIKILIGIYETQEEGEVGRRKKKNLKELSESDVERV